MSKQTAFVTGVTSGIGEATARALVSKGWRVVGTGRRADRLEQLHHEFGADHFLGIAFDIADGVARQNAIATLVEPFADIDLLVNNAGLALGVSPAHRVAWSDWATMIQTNIVGLTALTHALLPKLVERRGMIINMGSVAGTYPYAGGNVYGASKAFVHQFTLGLRSDLHGTGVRLTSIEPGMVRTEFTEVRRRSREASVEHFKGIEPLLAEDIARTILWITAQPAHVNINVLELMPTGQSFAGFCVHRTN